MIAQLPHSERPPGSLSPVTGAPSPSTAASHGRALSQSVHRLSARLSNVWLPQIAWAVGRTGRAGALGTAVSFACDDYVFGLDAIEERVGRKIPVEWPPESLFRSGKVSQAPRHSAGFRSRPEPRREAPPKPKLTEAESYGRTKRKSRRR